MRSVVWLLVLFISSCGGGSGPGNRPPVALDQVGQVDEDSVLNGKLTAFDQDGEMITFAVVEEPANGGLSLSSDGAFTYQPNADFSGTDAFDFSVTDTRGASVSATFTVEVVEVNDEPVAVIEANEYFLPNDRVDLDGSQSTDIEEESMLTFLWEQVSGPPIIFSDPVSPQPSFIAPDSTSVVEISLTVSDSELSNSVSTIVRVAGWALLASAGEHTVALREDGSLWAWGDGMRGQLGIDGAVSRLQPALVENANTYVSVSAGTYSSYALRDDGTLIAFGDNGFGQLGDGTNVDRFSPVVVLNGPYAAASAGGQFAVALKGDGTLWSWGVNDPQPGELGRPLEGMGSPRNDPTPGQIGTGSEWESVVAGGNQTSAIRSDGSLWSWGHNGYGELGIGRVDPIGMTITEGFPTQAGAETDWIAVYRGNGTLFAKRGDGSLWAAGNNENGALGLGLSNTIESSLVQVGTATDWRTLCSGGGQTHTIALKVDGSLWAWGPNFFGERGVGDLRSLRLTGSRSIVATAPCSPNVEMAVFGRRVIMKMGRSDWGCRTQLSRALSRSERPLTGVRCVVGAAKPIRLL